MRAKGHILALAEQTPDAPGGGAHRMEVVSRRHKRVNRSTFAAEINGLADALEPGEVLAMQYTEIVRGACTAHQLALDATAGDWALPVEAVVDAMSFITNVTASDIKFPLEESLVAIVMAIRERFSIGHLEALWWAKTDDMLADALTMGLVHREPLLKALASGAWVLNGKKQKAVLPFGFTPAR